MQNDQPLSGAITTSGIAGAVALFGGREGIRFEKAYGKRDVASGVEMTCDTLFQIASMTKAITSVAALQLVEAGKLSLDEPIGALLPELAAPDVLEGFDDSGNAKLRPAKTAISLRHLLTHTSGFGYDFMSADLQRAHLQQPGYAPGTRASAGGPLLFDPGARWEYGTSTDWAGFAVEAASGMKLGDYFAQHIFEPLGMNDTSFWPATQERMATLYKQGSGGAIEPLPLFIGGGKAAEFQSGGGGLFSTASDYMRFLRMILSGGSLDGARILSSEMMDLLTSNQIGSLAAGKTQSAASEWAYPYDAFPDMDCGWSLGFLLNPEAGPNGRAAGSMAWAGIANCYYWADPERDVIGIFLTQLRPFGDPKVLEATAALERMAYQRD